MRSVGRSAPHRPATPSSRVMAIPTPNIPRRKAEAAAGPPPICWRTLIVSSGVVMREVTMLPALAAAACSSSLHRRSSCGGAALAEGRLHARIVRTYRGILDGGKLGAGSR
ncbi:hypothetical protein AB1Y20_018131 [Prymnesium parvum]|uniref:Uncharacterized protein n=1 Tax=Prymnesium parvum TaxID=97485 RepID=A0AB34JMT6_PRYPA